MDTPTVEMVINSINNNPELTEILLLPEEWKRFEDEANFLFLSNKHTCAESNTPPEMRAKLREAGIMGVFDGKAIKILKPIFSKIFFRYGR